MRRGIGAVMAVCAVVVTVAAPAWAGTLEYKRLEIPTHTPAGAAPAEVSVVQDVVALCKETKTVAVRSLPALGTTPEAAAGCEVFSATNAGRCVVLVSTALREYWQACEAMVKVGSFGPNELQVMQRFGNMTPAARADLIALARAVATAAPGTSWADRFATAADGALQSAPDPFAGGFGSAQSAVVNGLATFLVNRAKVELQAWLHTKLVALCKTVDEFAPNLCRVLTHTNAHMSLHALGKALKAAAEADLWRLPDRMLWAAQIAAPAKEHTAGMGRVMYALGVGVYEGREPLELVAGLGALTDADVCPNRDANNAAGAKCAALVVALEQVGTTTATIAPLLRQLAAIDISADDAAYYALGVFVALHPTGVPADLAAAWSRINGTISTASEIWQLLKASRDAHALGTTPDPSLQIGRWKRILALTLSLVRIDSSVVDTSRLRPVTRIAEAFVGGDYAGAVVATMALLEDYDVALSGSVQRMLALTVELASAKSSDEVSKILEAAAAPPGGYAQKYKRSMFSITGLVGIGGFRDVATTADDDINAALSPNAALYPVGAVGLHYTGNLGDWYLGGYLSVLDVGALVRLSTDPKPEEAAVDDATVEVEESKENQAGFSQVFSPGLFFTVGLNGSPLVFGLGGSVTPDLHRIQVQSAADGTTTVSGTAFRLGAFLAVDVTLWGF